MTNEDRKRVLAALKEKQIAGDLRACPRCGQETMKPAVHTNALSRHADVYICDNCGTQEALLDFMNSPLPLGMWAFFLPTPPEGDFKAVEADQVWDILNREQIAFLTDVFERLEQGGLDSKAAYAEVIGHCAGLTQFWTEPFMAHYEAADGTLVIQIRRRDGKVQVTGSIIRK